MFSSTTDQSFMKDFLISLGAHVGLVLLVFAGGEALTRLFQSKDVEIIRSSVRVDVVGMPKFTVQELKKMEARPVAAAEPEVTKGVKQETKAEVEDVIKKDDLVIEEVAKKKTSFLNMINDYSSKKVAPKPEIKGEKGGVSNKKLDALILEGNKISKGSALVGEYTDQENSEFSAYVQSIPEIIRPFWKLPGYLLDKPLRCRIKIYISPSGELLKLETIESSGEAEFDSRAQKAVRDASPFPRPLGVVGERLTQSGIILGFPL